MTTIRHGETTPLLNDSSISTPNPSEQVEPVIEENLQRHLSADHLTMISIGGTIGTGLFIGSGATIALAGPAGAFTAFFIVSIMVFSVVTSLGEMATYIPVSGSFSNYATRFVDPA
jgi:amino acid permease